MTQQAAAPTGAPQTQTQAEPGSGVTLVPSLEERSAAAFGALESAGEGGAGVPAPGDTSAAGSSAPLDAAAKERADRRAKLAALTSQERERVDFMASRREADALRARLAAAEAKQQEYEAGASSRVDKTKLDNAGFFALAQELAASGKLTPQQLGEWIREQTANPELAAARAATTVMDPKLAVLEKQVADQKAMIDGFFAKQQAAADEAQERQAAEQFYSFTRDNSAVAPISARFLEKHGPDQFYKLALKASESVPPNAGPQAILDEIEENLASLGQIYMPAGMPLQRTQAQAKPPISAAAQAPHTISNTLAQQRATVVDEDADWASLTFEERSARLFR